MMNYSSQIVEHSILNCDLVKDKTIILKTIN